MVGKPRGVCVLCSGFGGVLFCFLVLSCRVGERSKGEIRGQVTQWLRLCLMSGDSTGFVAFSLCTCCGFTSLPSLLQSEKFLGQEVGP